MSTVKIDLERAMIDKRITLQEISSKSRIPYNTLYSIFKRRIIKLSTLRIIESRIGDLSNYISLNNEPLKVN